MQHKEGEFVTHDNTQLYYQAWLPDEDPELLILYLHGALAHSGEGKFVGERLSARNSAVYAFDQRGWGRSNPGKPGHIKRRTDVIKDVCSFLKFIKVLPGHSALPVVLMGHSMGGLLGLRTLIEHQDDFVCGVFSSPWIATRQPIPGYIKVFGGIISVIWPSFADKVDLKIDELTHDNAVISQHYRDLEAGLRKKRASARWFSEMQKTQKEVKESAEYITIPVIIMQAGQDLIVAEGASRDVYNSVGSHKKDWQYYERSYHELWNEVDRNSHIDKAWSFIEDVVKLD